VTERRGRRAAKAGGPRVAVHREVRLGSAELVPDMDRTEAWLLFVDGVPQSGVDLGDPGYLEFEYVRRIAHVVDLAFPAGEPIQALHLGGGALTLPRYIAVDRPGSRQLVAELDDALTSLVRDQLPLPAGHRIRVRAADARDVVESVRAGSYDLVIADVFAGAVTPPSLTTAEFAALTARALRPGGVYAVNVAAGPPLEPARSAVATVLTAYPQTCVIAESSVLKGRRRGNLVVVGSDQALPLAGLARLTASDPFPARVVYGDELRRFVSGAPVVTDALVAPAADAGTSAVDAGTLAAGWGTNPAVAVNAGASGETAPLPTKG
jgi:Spermine/spermidine synthase domain